jgi:hypothetical protein
MLRSVLGEIDASRLDASAVFRARIEGAVVALGVVLSADSAKVLDQLTGTPKPSRLKANDRLVVLR